MHTLPISFVILTYNEEKNIIRCLESISECAGEILIVDSFSTDKTLELVKRFTEKIFQHEFKTHATQWNWAFKNLVFNFQWCMVLDADQRLSKELEEELRDIFSDLPDEVKGFYVNRKQIFQGRWIRFGGYYPKYLLRIFMVKDFFCDEHELVDKRFYVKGKVVKLRNDIIEENLKENNISFWIEKHNRYSSLLAKEELSYRQDYVFKTVNPSLFGSPDQRTLWLKGIYYQIPLYLRSIIYFTYRYFFRLGILDGKEGLVFHFLQGFWYRFLVDLKIQELKILKNKMALVGESLKLNNSVSHQAR